MADEIEWTHRTLVVPVDIVEQVRALCAAAIPSGDGMFTTPLSLDGSPPATHYISSGLLDVNFAAMLDSPEAMQSGLASVGIEVDLPTCEAILNASDVSEEGGHAAMERLGLQMVAEDTPA
jgi:hypothetical protein